VSGDTETTVPDTVLAIYSSPGFCAGPFNLVGCNDDSGGLRSALSAILSGTSNYFLVVWVSAASAPLTNGNSAVQLKVSRPLVPANDVCAGAEVIPGAGPFPWLTTVVDTTLASTDSDPAPPACKPNSVRGVWFHFKPQYTTTYTLSTCAETETTVYNTSIALYSSVGGCQGPFQLVACNDSSCGPRAAITTSLNAGADYYLLVWESGNDPYTPGETSVQVRVTGLFAPGVVSLPASSISSTGAVLHASVNPNGALTTAWFEWGSSTNALTATAPQILAAGSAISHLAVNLATPGSGRTWFFRARATNILGSSVGAILSYLRETNRPTLEPPIFEDHVSTIRFTGNPGQSYLILGSPDLQSWSVLGSALDQGNGSFSFSELHHAAGDNRFYRVLSP
jgi:hypothetical protein